MSINGVGANGAGPEKINQKQVAQEGGKGSFVGGLKDAIGNLLNGGSKADAQPIKGLSIEHSGTVAYTAGGTADYSSTVTHETWENGQQVGMADYTATGTVGYTASGTVEAPYTGTVAYNNGGVSGMVDYSGVGTANYTVSDTIAYTAGGTVDYLGPKE